MNFTKTKLIAMSINDATRSYIDMIDFALAQVDNDETNPVVANMLNALDSVDNILDRTIRRLFHTGYNKDNIDLLNKLKQLKFIANADNNTSNYFVNIYLTNILTKIDQTIEDNYTVFNHFN